MSFKPVGKVSCYVAGSNPTPSDKKRRDEIKCKIGAATDRMKQIE